MPMYSVNAPKAVEVATYGIGFDLETWDFMVFKDGVCIAVLEPGESNSLLEEIKKATRPGQRT